MARIGTAVIDVQADTEGFTSGLSRGAKTAVKVIGGVAAAVAGVGAAIGALAIRGGLDRALNIEDAQAKLRGLGHDTETITQVMNDATEAVTGTAFGLDSAATIAASAIASGIEPGKELEGVLTTIADTATIAGTDLDEMGAIFGKVAAQGKLTGETLTQLSDRGINALQFLADELGVTTDEVQEMVSAGEIDFETFAAAMESNLAGAAQESGATTRGSLANLGAAMSRFGATAVQPLLPIFRDVFGGLIEVWDDAESAMEDMMATFQESDAFARLEETAANIPEIFDNIRESVAPIGRVLGDVWDAFSEGEGVLDGLGNVFDMVVEWLSTGGLERIVQTLINARTRILEGAVRAFQSIAEALPQILPAITETITGVVIPAIVGIVEEGVIPIAQAAVVMVGGLVEAIAEVAPQLLDAVIEVITQLVDLIVADGPMLLDAGIELFGAIVDAVAEIVPEVVEALAELIPELVTAIVDAAPQILDAAVELLLTIADAATEVLPDLVVAVAELVPQLATAIADLVPQIMEASIELMAGLVDALSDPDFLSDLGSAAVELVIALGEAIIVEAPQMLAAAIVLMSRLALGIIERAASLAADIATTVRDAITDAADQAWDALFEFGRDIMGRVAEGIADAGRAVRDALIEGVSFSLAETHTFNAPAAINVGTSLDQAIADGLESGKPGVEEAARNVAGGAVANLDRSSEAESVGSEIGSGFRSGILAWADRIASAARNIVSTAIAAARAEQDSSSPSKVFQVIGQDAARGYAEGLVDEETNVKEATEQVINSAISGARDLLSGIDAELGRLDAGRSLKEATGDLETLRARAEGIDAEIGNAVDAVAAARGAAREITAEEQVAIERAAADLKRTREAFREGEASAAEVEVAQQRLSEARREARGPTREVEDAERRLAELREEKQELPAAIAEAERDLTEAQLGVVDSELRLISAQEELTALGPEAHDFFEGLIKDSGLSAEAVGGLVSQFDSLNGVLGGDGSGGGGGSVDRRIMQSGDPGRIADRIEAIFANRDLALDPNRLDRLVKEVLGGRTFEDIRRSLAPFVDAPQFQGGGVVPGPHGRLTPVLAHAGERILPLNADRNGGGSTVTLEPGAVVVNNPAATVDVEDAIMRVIRRLAETRARRGRG